MPHSRRSALLTLSQLVRYSSAILVIGFTFAPVSVHGQESPRSTEASAKSCEGKLPPQVSSHQDSQSTGEKGTDHLKLSTTGAPEEPDPQGQFCKRDHSTQNALRPSIAPGRSDTTSEPPQSAATPPIAKLTDGKLTIRANGQAFDSVLESVRAAGGFAVEMPAGGDSEPVFLNVGPAPVTDALVDLMAGSKYNYIIVGSERDPRLVKRLILSEQTSPPSTAAPTQTALVAPQPALYGGQGAQPDAESDASEASTVQTVPIQPASIPSSVPTGINIQQLAAQSNKTPGQILDELQKRQQQVLDDQAASQSQSAPQQ